ncbi:GTP cyclohydrolase 1 type 2 [Clostridia bacterium]|nr:GTP cyclohydrolase 1 type 2 [Clostridia bacterium]
MKFDKIIAHLDSIYPKTLSSPGDPDGVSVCVDSSLEIQRVLVALDVTSEAIDYAVTNSFNCIITHHPLIFSPVSSLDSEAGGISRRVISLIRHNINAVSYHTRFDAAPGGTNDTLIKILGLDRNSEITPIFEDGIPAGRFVTFETPQDLSELCADMKYKLGQFYRREVELSVIPLNRYKAISKLAVVTGNGASLIREAAALGADAFLTGECKYHAALDAHEDYGMYVISAGHYETEATALSVLAESVRNGFPELDVVEYYVN